MKQVNNKTTEDPVGVIWNSIIGLTDITNNLSDKQLRKQLRYQIGELNKAYLQLVQAADVREEDDYYIPSSADELPIAPSPEDERLIDTSVQE